MLDCVKHLFRSHTDATPEGQCGTQTYSGDRFLNPTDRKLKPQDASPLFRKLPPEIRLIIYKMVLCETGQVHIIVKDAHRTDRPTELYGRTCLAPWRYCPPGSQCRVSSQLLRACRLVYCEAIEILYSGNAFVFDNQFDFQIFARLTPAHHLYKIKKVSVGTIDRTGHPQFKSLPVLSRETYSMPA